MDLTPEQIEVGKDNYNMAVGQTRRDFLAGVAAAGTGIGAAYFGYEKLQGKPVRFGFIGTGDEGSILLNEHPPEFMEVVAVADIRPTNRRRALHGDGNEHRQGLIKKIGPDAASRVKVYNDHKELLADPNVEAVVIAVPLNQHAPLTIEALRAGKHVLCEKLMAKTIGECKQMIAEARKADRLLAVGHQRHYGVLYENANHLVEQGLLGDIKYIRAQWHRNNSFPDRDQWLKDIPKEDASALEKRVKDYGYESLEKLVNWRLYNETGGGLMVELGSHQMDAASIFLGHVHPVAVQGYGGKNFYGIEGVGPKDKWKDRREIWDQIFVTFEFPGRQYEKDHDDVCVVTYSSISTNRFEPYGELVYGSRGTLIMKEEKEALLYKEETPWSGGGPDQRLYVVSSGEEGGPALDAYETGGARAAAAPGATEKISRGYREEMEHLCHLIRAREGNYYPNGREIPREEGGLRCNGVVAMADAVMALTANLAMKHHVRIPFRPEWFDAEKDATPEADIKKMVPSLAALDFGRLLRTC
jgi:predicted dehydrogenase